jgi:hypothetical protein
MREQLKRIQAGSKLDPDELIAQSLTTRSYSSNLQIMFATLVEGLNRAKKSSVAAPEGLRFLPKSITWQVFSTPDIQLFFPAKIPEDKIAEISAFAKNAATSLEQADKLGHSLQLTEELDEVYRRAEKSVNLLEKIWDTFAKTFSAESRVVDTVWKTFSLP